MVPRVVPEDGLLAANSLGQATRMLAGVIGAAVTGVVAGVAGLVWPVFLIDAGTFLLSALIVLGVSRESGLPEAAATAKAGAQGLGGAVADGLRLIARSKPLIAALGGVAVTMLGVGAINVLFIPFLVDDLGASPAWAGPLEGAQTLSMILAGGLMAGLAPGSACRGCSSAGSSAWRSASPRSRSHPARGRCSSSCSPSAGS